MNTKSAKSLTAANTLVWGDVFRPNADKRYAHTWLRVLDARTSGGSTLITYRIEGSDMAPTTMHTAALATMEVK